MVGGMRTFDAGPPLSSAGGQHAAQGIRYLLQEVSMQRRPVVISCRRLACSAGLSLSSAGGHVESARGQGRLEETRPVVS